MISFTWVLNTYGEPYSPSSLAGCTGYTGKYFTWSLLSVLVFYLLWIGVQLPQGEYISYGRGYLMVSIWCKVGYNSPGIGKLTGAGNDYRKITHSGLVYISIPFQPLHIVTR